MSFLRHGEIYRSDESYSGRGRNATHCQSAPRPGRQARRKMRASLIVHDEFPVGYSSAGCSPAEPASASPTAPSMRWADSTGNRMPANGNLSLISVPQQRGSVQSVTIFRLAWPVSWQVTLPVGHRAAGLAQEGPPDSLR